MRSHSMQNHQHLLFLEGSDGSRSMDPIRLFRKQLFQYSNFTASKGREG